MLQRPHFFPKESPRSVAQTAHCVRIISYMVKALGGSPAMQSPPEALSIESLSPHEPRARGNQYVS